jgi:hypothetical protein
LLAESGDSTIRQKVSVPAADKHPTLSFMSTVGGLSSEDNRGLSVMVDDGIQNEVIITSTQPNQWAHNWKDMRSWAGQQVTLTFTLSEIAGQRPLWAILDEVTLGPAFTDAWATVNGTHQAKPGQAVTVTIQAGNRSTIPVLDARLTVTLPAEIDLIGAVPMPSDPGSLSWSLGDLPANNAVATIVLTGTLRADERILEPLTILVAIGSPSPELEHLNNVANWTVAIRHEVAMPLLHRPP